MTKKVFILVFSILITSCEKEAENLLTFSKWTLDNGKTSIKETVKFNDDNTYIIESILTVPSGNHISGKISGNWKQQDNNIFFYNSQVYLPDDTSVDDFTVIDGKPAGSFFGYISNDSSELVGINDSRPTIPDIPTDGISDQTVWSIKKLTKNLLIVDYKGNILRYYQK
jgi:hypothetical protein